MNREIKFRGKDCIGEWWYGNLEIKRKITDEKTYESIRISGINTSNFVSGIIPETVGQFTGLCDKNGKEIYEGDIIECVSNIDNVYRHQVLFSKDFGCICQFSIDNMPYCMGFENCGGINQKYIDECGKYIIGNIFDNPELINK